MLLLRRLFAFTRSEMRSSTNGKNLIPTIKRQITSEIVFGFWSIMYKRTLSQWPDTILLALLGIFNVLKHCGLWEKHCSQKVFTYFWMVLPFAIFKPLQAIRTSSLTLAVKNCFIDFTDTITEYEVGCPSSWDWAQHLVSLTICTIICESSNILPTFEFECPTPRTFRSHTSFESAPSISSSLTYWCIKRFR